jgi:hypothetical protein
VNVKVHYVTLNPAYGVCVGCRSKSLPASQRDLNAPSVNGTIIIEMTSAAVGVRSETQARRPALVVVPTLEARSKEQDAGPQ